MELDRKTLNRRVQLDELSFIGENLARPECVLCVRSGTVYVSNWRGGVTRIDADGKQTDYVDERHGDQLKPNGIALLEDGSFLLANLGSAGGLWHLTRDGVARPWLSEIHGRKLPPCNYVMVDNCGRIWATVSTCVEPRNLGYRPNIDDGFIILVDADREKPRIVAEGLGYTNEVQLHPSGQWLYVNETFARRLSRFEIGESGRLGVRETVCHFGKGSFPDGLAFDQNGGIWVTSLVSNRLLRIDEQGINTILEDADSDHIDWVEDAFQHEQMDRPHLDTMKSKLLKNTSSIAFGGEDLKTAYIGCLLDQQICSFPSSVAGVQPVHWEWD